MHGKLELHDALKSLESAFVIEELGKCSAFARYKA